MKKRKSEDLNDDTTIKFLISKEMNTDYGKPY